MSRLYLVVIFLAAVLVPEASSRPKTIGIDDETRRGDEYVDKLLKETIDDHGSEYDPYPMEDRVLAISRKVAFVNITGEAKLANGYITGLKSLHRSDHCRIEERHGRLHVQAELGAGVLNFSYDGSVKFMNMGPTITVHGMLQYIEMKLEFSFDGDTGRKGFLKNTNIEEVKGMKVWITGLGPLNWAINPMIKAVTKIFKRYLRSILETKVERHISERITKYQFPVIEVTSEAPVVTEEVTTPVVVTEEETTEPIVVTEEETTEPVVVTEEETTEPVVVTEEETTEPVVVTEEETTEPAVVTEEETTEPAVVTEEETTEPAVVTEEETTEPAVVTEEETTEPSVVIEEVTTESVVTEEETTEPVVTEEETTEPVVVPEEETTESVVVTEEEEKETPIEPEIDEIPEE